jgi:hypothetical protein
MTSDEAAFTLLVMCGVAVIGACLYGFTMTVLKFWIDHVRPSVCDECNGLGGHRKTSYCTQCRKEIDHDGATCKKCNGRGRIYK